MNKNIILISIILIVLAIAGYFFMMPKKSMSPALTVDETSKIKNIDAEVKENKQNAAESSNTIEGSIMDLMKKGTSMHCTYTYNQDNVMMSGEFDVSGIKLAGKTTTKTGDKVFDAYMIGDGDKMYTWTTMPLKMGWAMKYSEFEAKETTKMSSEMKQKAESYMKNYKYNCSPASIDDSKFKVPADVKFTEMDFSKQMENLKNIKNIEDLKKMMPQ